MSMITGVFSARLKHLFAILTCLEVGLATGLVPATAEAAGVITAGVSSQALGFTYGPNGQDVAAGERLSLQ